MARSIGTPVLPGPHRTVVFALLVFAWLLPGLFGHEPWKPDEAAEFGVVYDLLRNGDFVVPTLAERPHLNNPPLYHATAAAFASVASPPLALPDAARLATGAYMLAALVFLGFAARELYDQGRGWAAILLLLGCFGLAIRGHQVIPDVALLAALCASLWGYALSLRKPGVAGFMVGTAAGLGFLAKGLIAPLAVALTAAFLLFAPAWRNRRFAACLAFALPTAAPWLVIWPLALNHRTPELLALWWQTESAVFVAGVDTPVFLLQTLPWFAWPAWPIAAWALWKEGRPGLATPQVQLPLAAFAAGFLLISLLSDPRDTSTIPLLPPLALLAAAGLYTLRRGAANSLYWFAVMGFSFFALVFWFYWSALDLDAPQRLSDHLDRMRPGYPPGFRMAPFLAGLALTAGWVALLRWLRQSPVRPAAAWAAGLALAWGLTMTLGVGYIDNAKGYRAVFESLKAEMPRTRGCVAGLHLGDPQRAMLYYYTGVAPKDARSQRARDCDLLLVQGDPRLWREPGTQWAEIWKRSRPRDKAEQFVLYRRADTP